jgi:hypothetical protein
VNGVSSGRRHCRGLAVRWLVRFLVDDAVAHGNKVGCDAGGCQPKPIERLLGAGRQVDRKQM